MRKPDLYWGDIHNHNSVGVGKGSMDRSYAIAQDTLDFYSFTPHGWWPDIPENDPVYRDYHMAGFARVKDRWNEVVEKANSMNRDNRFIALIAYEWHSLNWGDYCIYFPGSSGELYYAKNVKELQEFVSASGALMMPHHCAYRRGWRGTNWETFENGLSPTAEIFSEHGNSLETDSHFGMYRHSMGGSSRSQTVMEQLKMGRVLGFTAGTDDHFGYPGCYGEGLTGVYAESLTRAGILEAIKKRHTFGVTGDRIEVFLFTDKDMMGDVMPAAAKRSFRVEVLAQDDIEYAELIKNGSSLVKWNPESSSYAEGREHHVRIEWGWDGMLSKEVTEWSLSISMEKGEIRSAVPCFCGGAAIVEKQNRCLRMDSSRIEILSFSCRSNFNPTQSVVLCVEGGPDAKLTVRMEGKWGDRGFERTMAVSGEEISGKDASVDIVPVFSAPKLKIHAARPVESLKLVKEYEDPDPGSRDFYLVKVLQKNGHLAWTSPLWFQK